MTQNKPLVYFSYSQSDYEFTRELERLFEANGVHVVPLRHEPDDLFKSWLGSLTTADLIVIFISKAYLFNSSCMYDAIRILQDLPKDVSIWPIYTSESGGIPDRNDLDAFWKGKLELFGKLSNPKSAARKDTMNRYRYIKDSLILTWSLVYHPSLFRHQRKFAVSSPKISSLVVMYQPVDHQITFEVTPNTLSLYFAEDENTIEEIVEMLSFISDIYFSETGDKMVIKGTDVLKLKNHFEPVTL